MGVLRFAFALTSHNRAEKNPYELGRLLRGYDFVKNTALMKKTTVFKTVNI